VYSNDRGKLMIQLITALVDINKTADVLLQDYDAMVSLVDEMEQVSVGSLTSSVTIQYWYSFALSRCLLIFTFLFYYFCQYIVLYSMETVYVTKNCRSSV